MDALSRARRLADEAWQYSDHRWHDRQVEARDVLEAAVADTPDDPALLTAYGTVLCDLQEYDAAASALENAIRLGSEDANTFFGLAVVAFNHRVPASRPGTFRRPLTLFKKASRLERSLRTWPAYFDFHAQ